MSCQRFKQKTDSLPNLSTWGIQVFKGFWHFAHRKIGMEKAAHISLSCPLPLPRVIVNPDTQSPRTTLLLLPEAVVLSHSKTIYPCAKTARTLNATVGLRVSKSEL